MKDNIVLIGMPGAGKSTVGILLAKALNYGFIDTDLIIQTNTSKKLYEIINEEGIDRFKEIENETLRQIKEHRKIIATGGSAIFGKEAMDNLSENGIVVYLELSCEEIIARIQNIKTRGIAMKKGKTLEDVYIERTPYYNKYADITLEVNKQTVEETVEALAKKITEYNDKIV